MPDLARHRTVGAGPVHVSAHLSHFFHLDLDLDFDLDFDVPVFDRFSRASACESLLHA